MEVFWHALLAALLWLLEFLQHPDGQSVLAAAGKDVESVIQGMAAGESKPGDIPIAESAPAPEIRTRQTRTRQPARPVGSESPK